MNVTSTAAQGAYEGGAGYTGAKHAEHMLSQTLRWETSGEPVRVIEVAPGAVATEEFSLVRFGGDAEKAAAVYAGTAPGRRRRRRHHRLVPQSRPDHVNIDLLWSGRARRPTTGSCGPTPEIDGATVGGRT